MMNAASAAAKMYAAQPTRMAEMVPRARDSCEPAIRAMNTAVNTISRIAFRSATSRSRSDWSVSKVQRGQAQGLQEEAAVAAFDPVGRTRDCRRSAPAGTRPACLRLSRCGSASRRKPCPVMSPGNKV